MTNPNPALTSLSDHQLHQYTVRCASRQRGAKAASVAALAEVARRKLYLRYAPSLALYAQRELGYSEASAYRHSQAAFLAREFPEVIEKLESGELSLDAVTQAARTFRERDRKAIERPSIQSERRALQPALNLSAAPADSAEATVVTTAAELPLVGERPRSHIQSESSPSSVRPKKLSRQEKREVLQSIASQPRAVVQKKLGEVRASGSGGAAKARPRARLDSFDGSWSELRVYLSDEESAKLQHLRTLLSRAHPDLDLNAIFARILDEALDRHDPVRQEERARRRKAKAALKKPAKTSVRAPQPALANTQAVIEESSKHSSGEQRLPEDAAPNSGRKTEGRSSGSTGFHPKHETTGTQAIKNKTHFRDTALLHVKAGEACPVKTARKAPMNAARISPRSGASHVPSRMNPKRVPIPPTVERKIRVRDGNRCQYPVLDALTGEKRICGSELFTQIDHIRPVSQGGVNTTENLRVTCSSHNANRMMLERDDSFVLGRLSIGRK